MTGVAAAVVNFNAGELLLGCVRSLLDEGAEPVVVVDNGSTDGSLDPVIALNDARIAIMRAPANGGYGAGVNRAVRAILDHTPAVLVCNPDIVVHPGAAAVLAADLDADPGLGIVGPRLANSDGSTYPSARTFPTLADAIGHAFLGVVAPNNRYSRRYKLLDWDHETGRTVDWVSGACFLIRREAWDELGGFDEAYFMYMEDVDLCWRAGQAGWRVAYEPKAEVTHVQGASTDQRAYRMIVAHHQSMLRFASRTTTGPARWLLPVMAIGMAVRTALACGHKWRESRGSSATPQST